MRTKLVLALVLLVMLAGCGSRIMEGDIYEKEHQDPYTTFLLMPVAVSNGKTSSIILIPYIIYHPENWIVRIKDFDGEEFRYNHFYVHEEVYNAVSVGDRFRFDKSLGSLEEQIIKERQP